MRIGGFICFAAEVKLSLQDELASVCRRARPTRPQRPGEAAWDAPHRQGAGGGRPDTRPTKKPKMALILGFGIGTRDVIEDTVRDFNEPDDPVKAALACSFLPDFVCPVLRRRLVGRRILAGAL